MSDQETDFSSSNYLSSLLACVSLLHEGMLLLKAIILTVLSLPLIPVYWFASFFCGLDVLRTYGRHPNEQWQSLGYALVSDLLFAPFIISYSCVPQVFRSTRDGKRLSEIFNTSFNNYKPNILYKSGIYNIACNDKSSTQSDARACNIAFPHIMLSFTALLSITAFVLVWEGFSPLHLLPLESIPYAIAQLSTPALAGSTAAAVLLLGLLMTVMLVSVNKPYWDPDWKVEVRKKIQVQLQSFGVLRRATTMGVLESTKLKYDDGSVVESREFRKKQSSFLSFLLPCFFSQEGNGSDAIEMCTLVEADPEQGGGQLGQRSHAVQLTSRRI